MKRPPAFHAPRVLFRESRQLLDKLRDFERGSKVEALLAKKASEHPAIVECLNAFHEYVDCSRKSVHDPGLEQLATRLLRACDQFLHEVKACLARPKGRQRIDSSVTTRLILAHRRMRKYIEQKSVPLGDCTQSWARMITAADKIWPNGV